MTRLVADAVAVARAGRRILERTSFQASGGEFIGLVGPNGAGKSTLLRALCGLEALESGAVSLAGADVRRTDPAALARLRAYLPQQRELAWNRSVAAVVALGRFAYGSSVRLSDADSEAVSRALAATGMLALRDRDAFTLSGGEAARMHLARALAAETPALFADEPTSSLDPRHQVAIMDVLSAKAAGGGLVIAALHDLDLALRCCTRIIAMNEGRIVADGPAAQALDEARLAEVFGVVRDARGYRLSP